MLQLLLVLTALALEITPRARKYVTQWAKPSASSAPPPSSSFWRGYSRRSWRKSRLCRRGSALAQGWRRPRFVMVMTLCLKGFNQPPCLADTDSKKETTK